MDYKVQLIDKICKLYEDREMEADWSKIVNQLRFFRRQGLSYQELLERFDKHMSFKYFDLTKSKGGVGFLSFEPYIFGVNITKEDLLEKLEDE